MHKGIKILLKVIAAFVLFAIFFPLCLAVLLQVEGVQNYVLEHAADMATRKLGTKVEFRRLNIGFFDRVIVEGFYVEDYEQDTLIYASRAEVSVARLLLSQGVSFSSARLSDAKFFLKESPRGVMNIKEVVDNMRPKERKKRENPFTLSFSKLTIEGLEFRLIRNVDRYRGYGINWSNMQLKNLWGALRDFTIQGPILTGYIDGLSGYELSGFKLDDLSGEMRISSGGVELQQVTIATPLSHVNLQAVELKGRDWSTYKYYIDSVQMRVVARNSSLHSDDVAYFAPSLKDWHLSADNIDLGVDGTVDSLKGRIWSLTTGHSTKLRGDIAMMGLPDAKRTHFDIKVHSLKTNSGDASELTRVILRKELGVGVKRLLSRLGTTELSGRFRGKLSNFESSVVALTALGGVDAKAEMSRGSNGRNSLTANLTSHNFNVGDFVGVKDLSGVDLRVATSGEISKEEGAELTASGDISTLIFRGVEYHNMPFRAIVDGKYSRLRLSADEPILGFKLTADADLNSEPKYTFDLNVERADLKAMALNGRDTTSRLSFELDGKIRGRGLDDMQGELKIDSATYRYNSNTVTSSNILLRAERLHGINKLQLNSNIAEFSFSSRRGYKEAFVELKNAMHKFMPNIYTGEDEEYQTRTIEHSAHEDYTVLKLRLKELSPVTNAISEGLNVADNSTMSLVYNPTLGDISASVESDFIERRNILATRLKFTARNERDSLVAHASAEDLYSGAIHLQNIDLTAGARNNRFQFLTGFADSVTRLHGRFGVEGRVERDSQRIRKVQLQLRPSDLKIGEKSWRMFARNIEFDSTRVVIDRFRMLGDGEQMSVDGIASRSRTDSVQLQLKNFDLSPLTQVVALMGYRVTGKSNGYALVRSALKNAEIVADINIDSMAVNEKIKVHPLQLLSRWDFELNRAAMFIVNRELQDTVIRGFYRPSGGNYYARAHLDSIDMSAIDPILKGVISSSTGLAQADLILMGQGRNAKLSGVINAKNLSTTVDFTQVRYSVPEVQILVSENRMTCSSVPIFDPENNVGKLDFMLDLNHLSNISYRLDVTPTNMLVLNTTKYDNDLFYGKIYASGLASIRGDKLGVRMNITAETEDNSEFNMPLSGSSNVGKADFVIFESADTPDTTNYLVRKKMMFERRARGKKRSAADMDINLGITVHPNVTLQLVIDPQAGDIMRGKGEGVLNLHVNPRENVFEMTGDYEITEGSYLFTLQNIINKKFLIESGSTISWTGEPMDAMLNINAIYKLKASLQPLLGATTSSDRNANTRTVPVECVIHLGDRLSNPSKSFLIRVPQADSETQTAVSNILNTETIIARQFIYLLAFNSFYPENSTGSSGNIGAVASAATGFELLANQVSNILSGDDYNIILRYRPKTEVSSDEVDFGFSSNLIDNRLLVEVEGNYVIDNKQAVNGNMSNFMGEAYITWMIDRSGNLKLRGFTQTIDRFDETQGLQETGIGIYYKEDFDNFKDLKQRIKDRFSSEKRRERRAARRAERARQDSLKNIKSDTTLILENNK